MALVVIDPGHGGDVQVGNSSPNNAIGPQGTKEKDLTLDVALKARDLIVQDGIKVLLTRETDINIGLRERLKFAMENQAILLLSIHFNADQNPRVQGTETWISPQANNGSVVLANRLQLNTLSVTRYRDRGVKRAKFAVINSPPQIPLACCLCEISFLTNPEDEARLHQPEYRWQLGQAFHSAINYYLKLVNSMPLLTATF